MWAMKRYGHFLHILWAPLQQFLKPFFFHDPFFFLNDGANFLKALEYFLFAAVGFLFCLTSGGASSNAVNLALSFKSNPEEVPYSSVCRIIDATPAFTPNS